MIRLDRGDKAETCGDSYLDGEVGCGRVWISLRYYLAFILNNEEIQLVSLEKTKEPKRRGCRLGYFVQVAFRNGLTVVSQVFLVLGAVVVEL